MNDDALIAADIGNSGVKVGRFRRQAFATGRWGPEATLQLAHDESSRARRLADWVAAAPAPVRWRLASVNRAGLARLIEEIRAIAPRADVRVLDGGDVPLSIATAAPQQVGIDRLLAALAADSLRTPGRPAVIVDLGTAMTVDWVSPEGVFCGGAILPGLAMAARALAQQTDRLPCCEPPEMDRPPPPIGDTTKTAIRAGLFWGAVGAARELIARMTERHDAGEPEVFVTGGAAPATATLISPSARFEPHLTLAGIALTP